MSSPPITTAASGRWTSDPAPLPEQHRHESDAGERGRGHDGAQPLVGACQDGLPERQPVPLELADGAHHHESVQDRDAEERDKAHARRDREREAERVEHRHPAHDRHRDAQVDDRRQADRPERLEQQDEDQDERERHDQQQPGRRRFQVLELAAVVHPVAGRERDLRPDAALHVLDERRQVAPGHVRLDGDEAAALLARDRHRPGLDGDRRQRRERHARAGRRHDRQRLDGGRARPRALGEADDEVEAPLALVDLARDRAADGRLDDLVDGRDGESVAGQRRAVGADDELGRAGRLVTRDARGAGRLLDDGLDLLRERRQLVVALAEELHDHIAAGARR